jgi:hypothetical protein
MYTFLLFLLFLLFLFWLYIDIKDYHINRNRYNVLPVGKLTLIKTNEYRDENGIRWLKRGFLHSLLHNPFKYYVFETYDSKIESSSEFIVLKTNFDTYNAITFEPSSFNYYSSFRFPVKHFFTDVIPFLFF